jgi:hypothetical protein
MSDLPIIDKDFSDYYLKKMAMYSENAKSYIQISMACLVVPITFYRQFLGKNPNDKIELDTWLIFSWIFLLLSIGLGLLYQYFAIKRVETRVEKLKPRYLDKYPGRVYAALLVTFYLGVLFFVISACNRL